MSIGDKILVNEQATEITEVLNVVPVLHKDDGDTTWYEVCDATKSDQRLVTMRDISGNEISIIVDKESDTINMLLDLF